MCHFTVFYIAMEQAGTVPTGRLQTVRPLAHAPPNALREDGVCIWFGHVSVNIGGIMTDTPVFLAPMAGITDAPFRAAVRRHGAGLCVTEMVACREILTARPAARLKSELGFDEDAVAVQIAGCDPVLMADAARFCEDQGARIIDINFGCPAKRVVSGLAGSALMRAPAAALRIVESVVAAVAVPVTVKMRLGWDDTSRNASRVARDAELAGVAMVTVHGRTRCQFYHGAADWRAVAAVRRAVRIPVIVNGDIRDAASMRTALAQSGASGAMIGRGALGRPWLIAQAGAELAGARGPESPRGAELLALISTHYEAILAFYGQNLGLRVARKHLGWYLDAAGCAPEARREVLTETSPDRTIARVAAALVQPTRYANDRAAA